MYILKQNTQTQSNVAIFALELRFPWNPFVIPIFLDLHSTDWQLQLKKFLLRIVPLFFSKSRNIAFLATRDRIYFILYKN